MRSAVLSCGSHECLCERLTEITDLLPLAIWITDADGRQLYENQAAREFPADARKAAAFTNGERMRFLKSAGTEILVVRTNGRATHLATTRVSLSDVVLRELYGLSPAEKRVALGLALGRTPRQVAEDLSLSLHTVRTHIKNLFGKTQTRSQNELVVKLASGIAALRLDPQHSPN